MGGVVGHLFVMWVRSGFSASTVAASLTFVPPEPTYAIVESSSDQQQSSNTCYKRQHFLPNRSDENDASSVTTTVLRLTTRLGNHIPAFLYTPKDNANNNITIIYSHANATDCGAMHPAYVDLCLKFNVRVLAYEYSGYGTSVGTRPSEANTYADIEAAYSYVVNNMEDSSRIVLYGQSVGSGPSIYLASLSKFNKIAGMIIHSGFTSGMRVLTPSRALGCLDIYPNLERISSVTCPTLIIHGVQDAEVPVSHARELYEALPKTNTVVVPPYYVQSRGHNDIGETMECRAEYYKQLESFFKLLCK